MIGVRAIGLLAVLCFAASCGCSGASTSQSSVHPDGRVVEGSPDAASEMDAVPSQVVILGNPPARVNVALARTPTEQTRGLMYVQNLPVDDGMLFIFEGEENHSFWMRNTLISLDMIFIRADLTIAGVVANAVPMTDTPRGVGQPSRFVLEVNGGWAAAHGVTNDSSVTFEGFTP